MALGNINAVVFLCPVAPTGGPEAIHQASQVLNGVGLKSEIAYYGSGATLIREGNRFVCTPAASNSCLETYAKYYPNPSAGWLSTPDRLVILPEVIAWRDREFLPASVAVWWLSVDNALHERSPLRDAATRRSYFANSPATHFYQSVYAREFLRHSGVEISHPLGDYTDDHFTWQVPRGAGEDIAVAYNPRKGGALAELFFARHPSLSPVPLQGYTKGGMAEVFRRTLLYIDFGHLPGKDRLPREAAGSGTIVFVHKRGAGQFFDDYPIPSIFAFETADVENGRLFENVKRVISEPGRFWAMQETFREEIRWEKATLQDQVMKLLGRRRLV